jgi:hypothetical protein
MTPPHRNRVTPTGEIVAIARRGAWTGNRGNLHRGTEIVRPWASPHWLTCTLEWKGIRRDQWVPGRLTWLYFHDEAVSFAAGHRPCAVPPTTPTGPPWPTAGRCSCNPSSTAGCTGSGSSPARAGVAPTG